MVSQENTPSLVVEVYDGQKLIVRQTLTQTKIIIGRILSADFRIPDQRVSRIHALLEWLDDGSLRLTDLASTHGTFVNGERIVERVIKTKDSVAFASLSVRINVVAVAPVVESPKVAPYPSYQVLDPVPAPKKEPAPPASVRVGPDGGAQVVREPQERTTIRSLKETARTRGVLDAKFGTTEDLEVTVYWEETILHVDHFRKGKHTLTLGHTMQSNYLITETAVPENYKFVQMNGSTVDLSLHAAMKGSVRTQGQIHSIDDLMKTGRTNLTLGGSDIAKIRVGTVHFFLMFVPEPPPIPKAPFFDQGRTYWFLQFMVLGLAALLLSLGYMFQPSIEGQVKEFPEHLRKIVIQEFKKRQEVVKLEEVPPPPPPKVEDVKPPEKPKTGKVAVQEQKVKDAIMTDKVARQGGNEGEGARERGAEGKRGWQNAKNETGITNRPKPKNAKGRVPVQDAPVKAPQQTILGALQNTGIGGKLAKLSAGAGSGGAQGNDPLDQALLGTGGGGIRSGRGSGGSGLQGSGTGGGGTAVGVGGLGSKGFGGGATGDGVGSIPGKGEFSVSTEVVGVTVLGGLSREEIERVVKAHENEIQFCYQRALQRDPRLFGKITMGWVVGDGGVVKSASATENSTGSSELSNCILGNIRRWQFPSPPSGSDPKVVWPWIFKPQGT